MNPLALTYLIIVAGLLAAAVMLHLLGLLGPLGRRIGDALCRAPLIDLVLFYFTALPWFVSPIISGWWGLPVAIAAQISALLLWIIAHELTHPKARNGPRIYTTLDGLTSKWRNHLAVWWTGIAVPAFWVVRLGEIIVYPMLTWTVRLPKYRTGDWVNISRHKFEGLVGYDLIWCLYCDWMTGVWSLGGEMLRNVESFWCPIRFYSDKKCENCKVDFPDIDGGWVPANATMHDVTAALKQKYQPDGDIKPWFGHTTRLTVEGDPIDQPHPARA